MTLTFLPGTNVETQRAVVGKKDETAPSEENKLLKHLPLLKEYTLEICALHRILLEVHVARV